MSEGGAGAALRGAYLHGFASSSLSRKGVHLARFLAPRGIDLALPDLNHPSFAELTYTGALAGFDRLDGELRARGGFRWRLIGSSMGGYLAARWAELHPERVERLLLLCPGFAPGSRWGDLVGAEAFARWQREGSLALPDGRGIPTPVWWRFVEDARSHPATPDVPCPTHIVHGRNDAVVPFESSLAYARGRGRVSLEAVDDGHDLAASLAAIERAALRLFDL